MNKLHAVMLFNWLEMSRTANPPPTLSASPRQMNSWHSKPKGFYFVTVGACSSVQEANLAIYISNILIIYLSIHAEWADYEQSFPVHSQWEQLCTRIDSRATTKHQIGNAELYANVWWVPANHCELKVITFLLTWFCYSFNAILISNGLCAFYLYLSCGYFSKKIPLWWFYWLFTEQSHKLYLNQPL